MEQEWGEEEELTKEEKGHELNKGVKKYVVLVQGMQGGKRNATA